MWRRRYIHVGVSALAAPLGSWIGTRADLTSTSQDATVEQFLSDTYDSPGLASGISESGATILFGFDDGNLVLYDDARDGVLIPLAIDRSVSHIEVREAVNTAVIGWMDAHALGFLDLAETDGPGVEHPGLWDLDATPEATTASVSAPFDSPGSLVLATPEGEIQWETPLVDAAGYSVAITDDASHIAVGAGQYGGGAELVGSPGILLVDGDGTERWRHDHPEDVLSVGIDAERELVVAGTDDGQTIVLDFDGDVSWETDEMGGWVHLSADGSRLIVVTPPALVALDSETGEGRWTVEIGIAMGEDTSVASDGSRVFTAYRGAGEFTVVEEGEVVWSESHDVGPGVGSLAADGSTWCTNVTDLDAESSALAAYRMP